jgi:urea transporter
MRLIKATAVWALATGCISGLIAHFLSIQLTPISAPLFLLVGVVVGIGVAVRYV